MTTLQPRRTAAELVVLFGVGVFFVDHDSFTVVSRGARARSSPMKLVVAVGIARAAAMMIGREAENLETYLEDAHRRLKAACGKTTPKELEIEEWVGEDGKVRWDGQRAVRDPIAWLLAAEWAKAQRASGYQSDTPDWAVRRAVGDYVGLADRALGIARDQVYGRNSPRVERSRVGLINLATGSAPDFIIHEGKVLTSRSGFGWHSSPGGDYAQEEDYAKYPILEEGL